ncbi:MAG: LamG-like jellyroll fold domain-containing protein [Candidatus Paceibacterota bacterium]
MNRNIKTNLAFTLIELLVVIAIIGILSALIVIGMSSTTQKASVAKGQVFANSLRNSLMSDMVSEWKLDGNTNDTWAASYANNGTWSGPTAPNTVATYGPAAECVSGQCMDFDGVDDLVDFGNNASLSMGTKDHTVSLWIKFDNATAPQHEVLIISGGNIVAPGYAGYDILRYTGMSRLYVEFSDGSANNVGAYLSASGTLVSNIWYNIVVIFDRDGVAKAYINGLSQAGTLNISVQPGNVQNIYNLRLGAWTPSQFRLAGKMDEVRIFHAITTLSQIQQNYYAGLNKLFANRGVETSEYQQRIVELNSNYAKN